MEEVQKIIELATSINGVLDAERERWRNKVVDAYKEQGKMRQGWEKCQEALKRYGNHDRNCMRLSIAEETKCTCGYEQALKGEQK